MSKYSTHHHRFIDRQCRYAFRNIDAYTHKYMKTNTYTPCTHTQAIVPCQIILVPFEYFSVAFFFHKLLYPRMLRILNEIRRCLLYSRDFLFARMAEILEQHTAHGRPNVSRLAQGIKLRQPCCRGCSAPNRHASKYNSLFPPRSRHPFRLLYYLLLV